MRWQWHQLDHLPLAQKHITTPAPHHSVFTGQMFLLTPNQQCQSTEGTELKQYKDKNRQKQTRWKIEIWYTHEMHFISTSSTTNYLETIFSGLHRLANGMEKFPRRSVEHIFQAKRPFWHPAYSVKAPKHKVTSKAWLLRGIWEGGRETSCEPCVARSELRWHMTVLHLGNDRWVHSEMRSADIHPRPAHCTCHPVINTAHATVHHRHTLYLSPCHHRSTRHGSSPSAAAASTTYCVIIIIINKKPHLQFTDPPSKKHILEWN